MLNTELIENLYAGLSKEQQQELLTLLFMDGAFGLKKGVLHGDILLNLDSEEEGELYVGCAGGVDATIHWSWRMIMPTMNGMYSPKNGLRTNIWT